MVILREQNTSQTFYCIPREYTATSLVLTDELSNISETYAITPAQVDYFLEVSTTFDLKQDRFYTMVVYNGTDIVHRDRVFCTNQTTYSVNNDVYAEHTTTNEFIIIS